MFYLMTHSTHFVYGYMVSDVVKDHSRGRKTGNVYLTIHLFYLWLYDIARERGNLLPPLHGLNFFN